MSPEFRVPLLVFFALLVASGPGSAQESRFSPGERIEILVSPEEAIGEAGAASVADVLDPKEPIKYVVYVPRSESQDVAPGVFVFVSPTPRAMMPRQWESLMDSRNLIWIGAADAGNNAPVLERMLKAMLAPAVLNRSLGLNMERCYVAGFSGGAKTAARVAAASPSQFKGGIYMAGAVYWDEIPPRNVELLKQNHHVFIVGTRDPAMRETGPVFERLIDEGVTNARLIEVPNIAHRLPANDYLAEAIDYLDSRLARLGAPSFDVLPGK
jgi:predicted esterase